MDCTPGYLFLQNYLTPLCALRDVYLWVPRIAAVVPISCESFQNSTLI